MAKDKRGRKLPKGIRQRSESSFEGRVTVNGKAYTVHGQTITETQEKISELRYKLAHGGIVSKEKITFGTWFRTWIDEYKKNESKKGTLATYESIYRGSMKSRFENCRLTDIRAEHVQKYYNDLRDAGYKPKTIQTISAVLGGCLQQAYRNGLIERNPARMATLPKAGTQKKRIALTKEQQAAFMNAAADSYLYNLFAVMLRTGMRSGEVRGLRYSDIDRDKKVIHVVRTLREGEGFYTNAPKTKTSLRDIPLTDDLIQIFETQRTYWKFKVERVDRFLFCTEKGDPLPRFRVQAEIDRIIKKIRETEGNEDFPRITSHVFRHTFATRAIEAGMQPNTLKTILGHSALSMTMDLYSHVLPETRAAEMEKIASVF